MCPGRGPPGGGARARGGARRSRPLRHCAGCLVCGRLLLCFFFFQAEDGIRDCKVTGVQTCALPISGENRLTTLHLSMSDASGDSAIVEYINGRQVIHHGREYQVMTNSPTFDQQLALNAYWKQVGGTTMLPGTNRAADRFARASFYVNAIPKSPDPNKALASVFSVIRNASVPYGLNTPEEPNISSTRWRTVFDHQRKLYFFESALTPNTFWVDLKALDFSKQTGKVLKLDLGPDQDHTFSGDATRNFQESAPFEFLGL